MFLAALRGAGDDLSPDLVVPGRAGGSITLTATRGSRATFLAFWYPSTVLITMCSPSVSTQVWVSCGEPSGMEVAMKHGLA